MIKYILLPIMGMMAISASANGYYVQGNVGASVYDAGGGVLDQLDKNSNAAFRIAVGKEVATQYPKYRYAVDYTHFGKEEASDSDFSSEFKTQSVGVSLMSELFADRVQNLAPYAGLRLSLNELEASLTDRTTGDSESADSKKFGIGAIAGVQYKLGSQVALDVNAEVNRLGAIESDKVTQFGVNAGVRFNF